MELAVHSAAFVAPDSAVQLAAGEHAGQSVYPYTYLPTQKQFNADFLLTYLVHPGTAIYVGYNSDLQNLDTSLPGVRWSSLYTAKGYINDSRQFFVKVSYQFRF